MRSPSVHPPPSSMSRMIPGSPEMLKIRDMRKPPDIGIPARTRTRQHRRDSLDIDEVMNGSDYDVSLGSISTKQLVSPSAAELISRAQYPVSSQTRELMAFLAEGPPDPKPKLSQSGSELFEFLAQGPPDYLGSPTTGDSKAKSPGRLQRMISKLSIGEKTKASSDASSFKQPNSPARSTFSTKPSVTSPSSLASMPIPPLPKPPPQYSYSYKEDKSIFPSSSSRNLHQDIHSPNETSSKPIPVTPTAVPTDIQEKPPLTTHVNGVDENTKNEQSTKELRSEPQQTPPVSLVRSFSHKEVSTIPAIIDPPPIPFFTETDAKDMQRLLTQATTADECRLIFNMFMSRSCVTEGSSVSEETDTTSPSPSLIKNASAPLVHSSSSHGEALIERILIEFFLTGTALPDTISLGFLTEQNHPDVDAVEALPASTETQADAKPSSDSPSP